MNISSLGMILMMWFFPAQIHHGDHIAEYVYTFDGEEVELSFRIETAALQHIDMQQSCDNYKQMQALCLANYVQAHSALVTGGNKLLFELESAHTEQDYYIVTLIAWSPAGFSDTLNIQNNCFLEFDSSFQNRIILTRNDETKSYRLDSEHQALTLTGF